MASMMHTAAILAISMYVVTSATLVFRVIRPLVPSANARFSGNWIDLLGRLSFITGLIAHTVSLASVVQEPRITMLNNGADYFFWGSWTLAVAYFFLAMRVTHPIIGAFLVPAVVLFMGSSSYLLHPGSIDRSSDSGSLVVAEHSLAGSIFSLLHSLPALVAIVSLALAFAVSSVFLMVERGLKRKKSSLMLLEGPNLQVLDRLNRRLVQLGFIAISLVVLSGGLWAVSEQRPVFTADTSVISGLLVWLLLAAILHARLVLKWSPRRVSRITVLITGLFFVSVFLVMAWSGRVTHVLLA